MVTVEPQIATKTCSWDSSPNVQFNHYTTAGAEQIAPGPIAPLVADLFRRIDYQGLGELCHRLGVEGSLPVFEPPASNYLSVFGGRLALNSSWLAALVATWTGEHPEPDVAEVRRRVHSSFWPQCAAAIDRNNEKISLAKEKLSTGGLSKAAPAVLWQRFETLIAMQSHLWANHLGVSGAAAEYAILTAQLLAEELGPDFEPGMIAGLTAGLKEIESSRAEVELWKFGRFVASKPQLREAFRARSADQLAELIGVPQDPDWRSFGRRLRDFLELHGYRCAEEASPDGRGWSEDPAHLFGLIRVYAGASEEADPALRAAEKQRSRQQLEAQLVNRVSRARRREFLRTAGLAQHYLRNRERTKASWVRAVRLSRPILRELGNRMAEQHLLAEPADIFYLRWAEVEAFVQGGQFAGQTAADDRKGEAAKCAGIAFPACFEAPQPGAPFEKQREPVESVP
jgi:hypothetical protein